MAFFKKFLLLNLPILIIGNPVLMNHEENSGNFEGDMLLTSKQIKELFEPSKSGFINEKYRWIDGIVPYEILLSEFDSEQINKINQAIETLQELTCLKFEGFDAAIHKDYVQFQPSPDGCSSSVGRQGGRQTINLNSGCFNGIYTIIHEILHAVGFYHMQSSAERDDFVEIIWENITPGHEHNFNKFAKNVVTNFGTGYDYESVMHYSATAFAKPGTKTIIPSQKLAPGVSMGQRKKLSEGDIKRVNVMYNCKINGQ